MKTSIPFFVFNVQWTVGLLLQVIFRSNPENKTHMRSIFVPRTIETQKTEPSQSDGFASKVKMWANGVYVTAISDGYTDTHYGDQHETVAVRIKAKKYGCFWDKADQWVEFDVPVRDILQAEKNAGEGISEDSPNQIAARQRQAVALKAIHALLGK